MSKRIISCGAYSHWAFFACNSQLPSRNSRTAYNITRDCRLFEERHTYFDRNSPIINASKARSFFRSPRMSFMRNRRCFVPSQHRAFNCLEYSCFCAFETLFPCFFLGTIVFDTDGLVWIDDLLWGVMATRRHKDPRCMRYNDSTCNAIDRIRGYACDA